MLVCSKCGEANPERGRFCGACGAPLGDAIPGQPESRRTVTVVFTDISGSTAMGERLDPEITRRVMSGYFRATREAFESHGGTVEKFIGDAVMAVFGLPTIHEDDAFRAVKAAMDAHRAVDELNKELTEEFGIELHVRTGINTGEVVAGPSYSSDALVTGDPVNTAARLEQSATPGTVLVGAATYRLVRDAVEAERVTIEAKGKEQPIEAHRILEVHAASRPLLRRVDVRFVGRDFEVNLMRGAFDRCVRERTTHLVTIFGAAGIGKTRLVTEFVGSLAGRASVLIGRCVSYGEGVTYRALVEAIRSLPSIEEGDLEMGIERDLPPEEPSDDIANILGRLRDGGEEIAAEDVSLAFRKLLASMGRSSPVVLVIEDLQWAQPALIQIIDQIVDWSRGIPLLILCTARPELLDMNNQWAGGKLNSASLLLEPLSEAESDELVGYLLGDLEVEDSILRNTMAVAEGHPLFLEELITALSERGHSGNGFATPSTINAVLAARLDGLEPTSRAVLQRAAVVGREFASDYVSFLMNEDRRGDVTAALSDLVRSDLIRPESPTSDEAQEFRFRHSLVRDAAYQSIPLSLRAELHRNLADWIGGERSGTSETIAHHQEAVVAALTQLGAPSQVLADAAESVVGNLLDAARTARNRDDPVAALDFLERATANAAVETLLGAEARLDLAAALEIVGEMTRRDELLRQVKDVARALGDDRLLARVGIEEAIAGSSDLDTADEVKTIAAKTIPVLEAEGDDAGLARAWLALTMFNLVSARGAALTAAAEKVLEHASRAGVLADERNGRLWIGIGYVFGPMPAAAALERLHSLYADDTGGLRDRAHQLVARGMLHSMLGEVARGRREVAAGISIETDLGLKVLAATSRMAAGHVEHNAGDPAAAERNLHEAVAGLHAADDYSYLCTAAAMLADVKLMRGAVSEAMPLIELAESTVASNDIATQALILRVRACLAHLDDRHPDAEEMAHEAVAIADTTDFLSDQAWMKRGLAEVLLGRGKLEEAAQALLSARALYRAKGHLAGERQVEDRLQSLE